MISIKIVLGHKPQQGGLYPVRIRFIDGKKVKYVGLNMLVEKENFENETFKRKADNSTRRNQMITKHKLRAQELLDEFNLKGNPFSIDDLVNAFKGNAIGSKVTVAVFFDEIIAENTISNKLGTAKAYHDTKNSFYRYNDQKLTFWQLDNALLKKYESLLRRDNNQNGGIAFRMLMIRRLFNIAIERGIIDRKYYPFDTYKIAKLKSIKNKRALSKDEFNKLKAVCLNKHPNLQQAHDYFLFSFYTRGMNFTDMMFLKKDNINNGKIEYTRQKTGAKLSLKIIPVVQDIVDRYESNSVFTFPMLLRTNYTANQIANRKKKLLKKYNTELKQLAKLAGIKPDISSYVARHTYATLLKFSGVSTDIISQSMGHSSVLVTSNYLKDFGSDFVDNANNALLDI